MPATSSARPPVTRLAGPIASPITPGRSRYAVRRGMADDARAFWVAAPGRGEIRSGAAAAARRAATWWCARSTAASAAGPRRWCSAAACRRRIRADARAVSGRRVSGAGEVRLRQRRRGGARARRSGAAAGLHAATRTRRATSSRPARCTLLPDGVPPRRAVLAANLETAINGVWDARRSCRRSAWRWSAAAPSAAWSPGWRPASPAARSSSSTCARLAPAVAERSASRFADAGRGDPARPTWCSTPAARPRGWRSALQAGRRSKPPSSS